MLRYNILHILPQVQSHLMNSSHFSWIILYPSWCGNFHPIMIKIRILKCLTCKFRQLSWQQEYIELQQGHRRGMSKSISFLHQNAFFSGIESWLKRHREDLRKRQLAKISWFGEILSHCVLPAQLGPKTWKNEII